MPSQIYPDGQLILNGKYRILKMIGEGASAQVFLAQHVRMGNALRALKVLRRGIAGAGSTEIEDYIAAVLS